MNEQELQELIEASKGMQERLWRAVLEMLDDSGRRMLYQYMWLRTYTHVLRGGRPCSIYPYRPDRVQRYIEEGQGMLSEVVV